MHTMPVRRPHRAIVLAICRRHCCRRCRDTMALAICVASSSSSPDWCGHAVIVVVSHQLSSLSSPVVVTPWYWPHPRHVVVGSPSFSPAVAVVVTVSCLVVVVVTAAVSVPVLVLIPIPLVAVMRACSSGKWWEVVVVVMVDGRRHRRRRGGGGGGDGGHPRLGRACAIHFSRVGVGESKL